MLVMSSGGSNRLSRRGSQPRRAAGDMAATASAGIALPDPVERIDGRVLESDPCTGRPLHGHTLDGGGAAQPEVQPSSVLGAEAAGGGDLLPLPRPVPVDVDPGADRVAVAARAFELELN